MTKVTNKEYLDTGGGCMVLELTIEDYSDLKSITINEEGIVGRNKLFFDCEDVDDVLWIATDYEALRSLGIPLNLLAEILSGYKDYLKTEGYIDHLGILDARQVGGRLQLVVDALHDFNARGFAVIAPREESGLNARDVAEYVLYVLNELKYNITHYYHDVENSYFIERVD